MYVIQRHLLCGTLMVSAGQSQQRIVETPHLERDVSLSLALVPYRGGSDAQRPNKGGVANEERDLEVRHLKGFPARLTVGGCQAVPLQQQRILDITSREGGRSLSMALVPYRGDTQRLRPTMQHQEQDAVDRGHEV
jgi:hypothetical protein